MSEAARPADPERALAAFGSSGSFGPMPGPCASCGDVNYPLSFGGPSICPSCDCSPPSRRQIREMRDARRRAEAERDALRAEFEACVRALASIRETARRDYTLALMPDVVADSQRALSGPLAAAVLRSPEPTAATESPADGGAP